MPEFKLPKLKTLVPQSIIISLFIAFLTLALAVLLIASGLQIYFNFRAQQELIADRQQLIAQNAANTVISSIQEKFSMLKITAKTGAKINTDELKRDVEKLMAEPAFRQLVLLDSLEKVLIRVTRLSRLEAGCLREPIIHEVFLHVRREKMDISPICIDKVTNEPMVILSVPVTDIFGNFQGALAAEVNLKFMWELIGEIEIGKEGVAYVVNRSADLIAFGDISRVLGGENLIQLKEVAKFVGGEELPENKVEISKGIFGTKVLTTHIPLKIPDWAVVVELPVMEAYETVIYGIGLSVVVIILSIALAIVVSINLSKRITKPIIEMRNAALEIRKGKLGVRIEVKSRDEIGELATSFNEMASHLEEYATGMEEKIEERTRELEEAKASLEIKVEARTKELKELAERREEIIKERTKELYERIKELEKFRKLTIGRELRMIELKNEIKRLKKEKSKK